MNKNAKKNENEQNMSQTRKNTSVKEYEELEKKADQQRTRKPGSQSNSSDRHNNGRGGGK